MTVCAQMDPHLSRAVPGTEPVLTGHADQVEDLGVAQSPLRGPATTGHGVVVGAGSDRGAVLGQHATDRLDSQHTTR
jgi:hypothetical protein